MGAGFFARAIKWRLADEGIVSTFASRRGADIGLDVEDRRSIGRVLRPGDVVVDTAGPFQTRSTYLAEGAIGRACDVVDLSDSLAFAERVLALHDRAAAAGVHLVTSCSAITTVAAAAVARSGIAEPTECDIFLAPASAETANPATVRSLLHSLGTTIRTLRDGELKSARGWLETRAFPRGRRRGHLVESAAGVLLPRSWPSLRRVDFWVDPNAPVALPGLALAARVPALRSLIAFPPAVGRALGRRDGVFAVAVRAGDAQTVVSLVAARRSYLIAAEPAAMAAAALARGERMPAGVVPAHEHVDSAELFARLAALGISLRT